MPSPFPGMDPYLEGHLWPDVHHRLASEISRRLMPQIAPRYVARIAVSVFIDRDPDPEIGVMYPDVEIQRRAQDPKSVREVHAGPPADAPDAAPPRHAGVPVVIPLPQPVPVRLATVEVRDAAGNRLVTAIEIVSPVNKRGEGLARYRHKREGLMRAGIHIVEIDLIRRGTRPLAALGLPDAPWMVTLTRAGAHAVEVWPIDAREPLPVVPLPLTPPDPDAVLELQATLDAVYDEAAYGLSIDYRVNPPPPPLTA